MAQAVEHILGKDEVTSSSLVSSSTKKTRLFVVFFNAFSIPAFLIMAESLYVRSMPDLNCACRFKSVFINKDGKRRVVFPVEKIHLKHLIFRIVKRF